MKVSKLYGNLPTDLGVVGEDIDCSEMMYYLYLPIKLSGGWGEVLEPRLFKYSPIIQKVYENLTMNGGESAWEDKNVYLTVKTLYVSPRCLGQRLGWHSDGFMTDDINYIWYTDVPTIFLDVKDKKELTQHHDISRIEMFYLGETSKKVKYPNRHLLRLDETVIHKVDDESDFYGIRTFVKVSVSDHIYALKGNSINPFIDLGVEYKERSIERNCPVTHREKK